MTNTCPHCGKGWGDPLQACAVFAGQIYHVYCADAIRKNLAPGYFEPTPKTQKAPAAELPAARAWFRKKR